MPLMRMVWRASLLLTFGSLLAACGGGGGSDGTAVPVTSATPALTISPASASLDVSASQTFTAAGGRAPYTFSVSSGGGTVDTTGHYTAPNAATSASVVVTDAAGGSAQASVTVQAPLTLSPTSINLTVNGTTTFAASGGHSPYTFSLVSGGGAIDSVSGLYTAPGVPTAAVVQVTDAAGAHVQASATSRVPVVITPPFLTINVGASVSFSASGGLGPYQYSLVSGPGGINAASGLYTASATAGTVIVQATDAAGISVRTVLIVAGPTQLIANPAAYVETDPINAALGPAYGVLPERTISLSMINLPSAAQYLTVTWTHNVLWSVSVERSGLDTGTVRFYFLPPGNFGPGTYSDQIEVRWCEDVSCARIIPGADLVIPLTYTVTAATGSPSLTFGQTSITAQALPFDGGPAFNIAITPHDLGAPPYLSATHHGQAVSGINADIPLGVSVGALDVSLQSPSILGPGTYTDTVDLTACYDHDCRFPIPGSPYHFPVNYAVSDTLTMAGPNGYTLTARNVSNNGMAWDAVHQVFYVLLPASTTVYDTVAVLDPVSAQLGAAMPLAGRTTGAATVSADGAYLYVGLSAGRVERLALPSLAPDLMIAMTACTDQNFCNPSDIQPSPVSSRTIAVALSGTSELGGGLEAGVAIFDDAVQRPNVAAASIGQSGALVDMTSWNASGTTLYGTRFFSGSASTPGLYVMPVDASGVTSVNPIAFSAYGRPQLVNGGIFLGDGHLFDIGTLTFSSTVLQPFASTLTPPTVIADPSHNKYFALGSDANVLSPTTLRSFDSATRASVADLTLPGSLRGNMHLASLTRWGTSGLAFTSLNFVVLISGPFVGP